MVGHPAAVGTTPHRQGSTRRHGVCLPGGGSVRTLILATVSPDYEVEAAIKAQKSKLLGHCHCICRDWQICVRF